jgi:hypothetical protein
MVIPFFYFFLIVTIIDHLYNIKLKDKHFFNLENIHIKEQYFYEQDKIEHLIILQFDFNIFII